MTHLTYQAALDYLYSFIDYSVKRSYRYSSDVFDLSRVTALLERLGNPQQTFRSVHVAGTKGKGSTSAFIESALRSAGYRTGLYTSPHLMHFTERIQVQGEEIPKEDVARIVTEMQPHVEAIPGLTTYELVTVLGFLYFAQQDVDCAVVEVGLGGRLDATNVLDPMVSVITSISYDHMHLLGNSLSDIAREKGGIIKANVPVVISPQQHEVRVVLSEIASEMQSPLFEVGQDWHFSAGRHDLHGQVLHIWSKEEQGLLDDYVESAGSEEWTPARYSISLLGYHQIINAATAYTALKILDRQGVNVEEHAIRRGFKTTSWPGRFQILSTAPFLVVDSAHNRDSALKLRIALDDYFPGEPVTMIFGASEDKDIPGMLAELLPRVSRIIVTQAEHPRAAATETLTRLAQQFSMKVQEAECVEEALEIALARDIPGEVILATGSLFIVGDVLAEWQQRTHSASVESGDEG